MILVMIVGVDWMGSKVSNYLKAKDKIADALEKIFEDVSKNGTASINEIIPLAEIRSI